MTRLLPGVHVVARDADHVQVGLDPPHRVIVRRRPDVLELLADLRRGLPCAAASPATHDLLRALAGAGLLERESSGQTSGQTSGTVVVVDHGLGLEGLVSLLASGGLGPPVDDRPPDLYVVGSAAPLHRATLDDWLGEGAPHLVLAGTGRAGSLRLGPLVVPGTTACLRCVDAHEATLDPRRTLVVEQLADLSTAPLDPLLLAQGVAGAAREAQRFLAGELPATWSATIDLDEPVPLVRAWARHPHCGCAWDELPY